MDQNYYKTYFQVEKEHWWFQVRRNLILSLLNQYATLKTEKIFDFGCGSGYLVGFLQKLGYEVAGSDVSSDAIAYGVSQGVRNLKTNDNYKVEMSEQSSDLVLALDVIEHIKDDSKAVADFEKCLKPGGRLVLTVPAYQWMWGVTDEAAHHYRRYTASSLIEVIEKNTNLKIERVTYFNTFLFVPIAIVRMFSKWLGLKERESDFDLNNKWLNIIFFYVFNTEIKLLNTCRLPFGVSILLVAKK